MFLSRMILDPAHPQVRRDIGNCQELHRSILRSFPQLDGLPPLNDARHRLGVLYRLETDLPSGQILVLVQSGVEPDWSRLPKGYFLETDSPNPQCKSLDEGYGAITNGMRLVFRLKANPTKRIGKADEKADVKFRDLKKRRRVEIQSEKDQVAWLARKGGDAGFTLTTVAVSAEVANARADQNGRARIIGNKLAAAGDGSTAARRQTMTFGAVTFEGVLEVTDADKFRGALANGIGSGKAYGFGLLSVAREAMLCA